MLTNTQPISTQAVNTRLTNTHSSPPFKIKVRRTFAVVLILLFIGFVKLGFWQLDHAAQKNSLRETRTARMQSDVIDIDSLALQPVGSQWYSSIDKLRQLKSQLQWLNVSMQGQYLHEQTLLIGGHFFRGQAGFEVITPFRVEHVDAIVLVSRGWISAENDDEQLQQAIAPKQLVDKLTVKGSIHVPIALPLLASQAAPGNAYPTMSRQLDLNVIAKRFEMPVFAYVVRLDDKQQELLQRHWRDPEVTPGSHRSYAVQWFVLAMLCLVILVLTQMNIITLTRAHRSKRSQ